MITHTAAKDGTRNGLTQDKMYDLVVELGCVDALMFDGGGSAQMITLEGNDYVRRCSASDGSVRNVVNGLVFTKPESRLILKGAAADTSVVLGVEEHRIVKM